LLSHCFNEQEQAMCNQVEVPTYYKTL
jgi:hypothetical protein